MRFGFRAALLATAATMAAALAVTLLPGHVLAAAAPGAEISVSPLQAALIGLGYYLSYAPWWFGRPARR